jgi:hypothetical protein
LLLLQHSLCNIHLRQVSLAFLIRLPNSPSLAYKTYLAEFTKN